MSKPKAMVVLSGGQDSTTCLYWAVHQGYDVHAITFDYGQRHKIEIQAALVVASLAGLSLIQWEVVKLGQVLNGTSPLVSDAPLEQYADHKSLPGGLEKTFVPMRNQLFLTIAANHAFCVGADIVITGVCEEDFGGYPDCRREFIDRLVETINLGTFGSVSSSNERRMQILTPLMYTTKAESVRAALKLPGCYKALAYTHTAYDGQYPPLGHDHATLLRAKGFEEARVPDPLILRACREGLMAYPETPNYTDALIENYTELAGMNNGHL